MVKALTFRRVVPLTAQGGSNKALTTLCLNGIQAWHGLAYGLARVGSVGHIRMQHVMITAQALEMRYSRTSHICTLQKDHSALRVVEAGKHRIGQIRRLSAITHSSDAGTQLPASSTYEIRR